MKILACYMLDKYQSRDKLRQLYTLIKNLIKSKGMSQNKTKEENDDSV